MLRLGLLGPPTVEVDGAPATFDTRKSVALLALLAVDRRPRSRETVAARLWPEADDTRSRSSLRRTLSVTSAAVGAALKVSRSTVELDPENVWCDLWEFGRLSTLGDTASLSSAATLYRDDFLAGFRARAGAEFDHWHELVEEEYRQRLSRVLDDLVAAQCAAGDLDGALFHARRWLSLDPLHEAAHQALMRVLAWSGQQAAALDVYRRCVRVLDEQLGVAPLDDTTRLYESIRARQLPELPPGAPQQDTAGAAARVTPLPVVLKSQEAVLRPLAEQLGRTRGAAAVAVLTGPSGSGKSWLVEELRRRLGGEAVWISARCHEAERPLELGCVTELLRSALTGRAGVHQELSTHDAREVARLVPDLVAVRDGTLEPLQSPGAQVRFFRAVGTLLAAAASGSSRAAIVVEDVGHVDESSAQLLGYLVRRVEDLPAPFLFTWDELTTVPSPLAAGLVEADRRSRLHRFQSPRLDRDDVATLLSARGVETVDPTGLLRASGGLVLLALAYAEALVEDGPQRPPGSEPSRPEGIPMSARRLFADRLERTTSTTSQVLHAAAVLGAGFDADLLRATSGRSASEVADALDEALGRGLLEEQGTSRHGRTYEFPFEGLREVAYGSCGSARRRLLHGRAGDALVRRAETTATGSLLSAVALHLAASGRQDEAAEWFWRAAERSRSLFAHAEVLAHLRRALELGHPAAESHRAIADALVALGRYREACLELEKAAASIGPLDSGDARQRRTAAAIEHQLAAVHERLGDWPVAATHIDAALELAGDDPVLHARIQADRAFVAYECGDPAAHGLALEAMADARAVGDPQAMAQATNVAGMLASLEGRAAQAAEWLRESLALADQLEDPSASVAALNNLARVLHAAGQSDEALQLATHALRRGIEHGDVHRVAALHSNFADLLHAVGRREESIVHLKEAASGFASVDGGEDVRPGVWTLTRW